MTSIKPGPMGKEAFSCCKICIFDAYGTLFDVNSAVTALRDKIGDIAASLSALWRTKQLEYSWLRSLMGCYAPFWQVTGEALDFALARFGIHDPLLRSRLMGLYLELEAYPEVKTTLQSLRLRGFKTAILSNGSKEMVVSAVRSADLYDDLDLLLTVEDVEIFKPHPSVYQIVLDRFNVAANEVAFQSSNGWDIAGAARFGFNTIWINRAKLVQDVLPSGPQQIVQSLDQMLSIVPDRV